MAPLARVESLALSNKTVAKGSGFVADSFTSPVIFPFEGDCAITLEQSKTNAAMKLLEVFMATV